MPIHLNADAPSPNALPTILSMEYITLAEYCRLAGLDYDATFEALTDSVVTFGGTAGEMTFISAANLARVLGTACPKALDHFVVVWLG